ncbi:MAG: dihydropteroate synthase [Phycisphaerales bacterium]|nr:dihydropteroate synthase [Phycisphaerales bacterium]
MTHRVTSWAISDSIELSFASPILVGVLNVTPDSFSDGGRYHDPSAAVRHGHELIEAGASMLDVGGESTRPGAEPVPECEQILRTQSVIQELRSATAIPISIDTTRAAVAEAALDAGADVINDVSGGLDDPALLPLAARRGCGLVLMHRRCRPAEDAWSDAYASDPIYGDVTLDVRDTLLALADRAIAAGVDASRIAIDPGLGFGKSVGQNWELVARMRTLVHAGYPVLAGASRKSFIGAVTGQSEPSERVVASVGTACWLAGCGVQMLRVHDVAETAVAIQSTQGILNAGRACLGFMLEATSSPATMSHPFDDKN